MASSFATRVTLLVSSEAFQNCDPLLVKEVFKEHDVKVVLYIRNEADYLASAYNQKVHATNYKETIYVYEKSFDIDYLKFLDSWSNCFKQLNVRIFDRNRLYRNDIVEDFILNSLKINNFQATDYLIQANPSLGGKLLQ